MGRLILREITEIINERKFIDDILATGYLDQKNCTKILLRLAKHYYWDLGYKERRTVKALEEYTILYHPRYDKSKFIKYEKYFKRLYRMAQNSPICEADGIWITQKELDTIAELNNKVQERLAFVMLCYAKLLKLKNPNANGWVYQRKQRDAFVQARINCNMIERESMIADLIELGYLYPYKMPPAEIFEKMSMHKSEQHINRMNDVRVTYMDTDNSSTKVIFISDWRELGYYYRRYKGENIIQCAKCGKLTRGNKNGTKKYCRQCAENKDGYDSQYKYCQCSDCGKIFTLEKDARPLKRCEDCRKEERKEHNRKMYEQRKNKNSTNLAKDEV